MGRLHLNLRKSPRRADIARTVAEDEVIVNERFAQVVRDYGLTGVDLRAVENVSRTRGGAGSLWYQLAAASPPADVSPATVTGLNPFDRDSAGEYRCPRGDTLGLNLLSELAVTADTLSGDDFQVTRQFIGANRGLLVPAPLWLLTPRAFNAIRDAGVVGFAVERARVAS